VSVELDPEQFVTRSFGRRNWLREARRSWIRSASYKHSQSRAHVPSALRSQLGAFPRSWRSSKRQTRPMRLNRGGVMSDGRRFGGPPKPYQPPATPVGQINTTDHDSRIVRTAAAGQAGLQRPSGGQRAPDRARCRGHRRLARLRSPRADGEGHGARAQGCGYQRVTGVCSPTPATGISAKWSTSWTADPGARPAGLRPAQRYATGWDKGSMPSCAECSRPTTARRSIENARDGGASVWADQVQPSDRPLPTTRQIRRALGMRLAAATHNLLKLHSHRIIAAGA